MSVVNWYEHVDKKKIKKYPKNEHFKLPFRQTISAASGQGKTITALNVIYLLNKCFTKIVICTKNNELLYDDLKDKLDNVEIFENGNIPSMSDYDDEFSKLIIFDDLVLEPKKTQSLISEYYIRARKRGWSLIYISQSYFSIPRVIRINSQYSILCRNLTDRDIKTLIRDVPTNIPANEFVQIYKSITKEPLSSMMIDIENRKIYKNLTEFKVDL